MILLPMLALGLVQATTTTQLGFGADDDTVQGVAFNPAGTRAFLSHFTGSLTRYDVAGGRIDARVEFDGIGGIVRASPSGAEVNVLDPVTGELFVIDANGMSVRGSVETGILQPGVMFVDPTGARAVVAGRLTSVPGSRVAIVDLAQLTLERTFFLDSPLFTDVFGPFIELSSDGTTMVVSALDALSSALGIVDIRTGSSLGMTSALGPSAILLDLSMSQDRNVVLATSLTQLSHTVSTVYERFDALTLQSLNTFDFGSATVTGPIRLSVAGDRATAIIDGRVTSFPITNVVYDPADPAVVRYGGTDTTIWELSGDSSRLILFNRRGGSEVYRLDGTPLGSLVAPIDWMSEPGSPGFVRARSSGAAFIGTRANDYDRIIHFDIGAAVGPFGPIVDVNSGFGDEFDYPAVLELVPGTDLAVVTGRGSDSLAVCNTRTGTVTARGVTARAPIDVDIAGDGSAIVGHRDGTLLAFDTISGLETGRVFVGSAVEDVEVEPSGTRVWARVSSSAVAQTASALVLVEMQGPAAGEVLRVPIAGGGDVPLPLDSAFRFSAIRRESAQGTSSVAYDFARGVAYVASPGAGVIETVDLALGAVIASTPSTGLMLKSSLLLAPDGSRLFAAVDSLLTMGGSVRAFDRIATGLSVAWTGGPATTIGHTQLAVSEDSQSVFVASGSIYDPTALTYRPAVAALNAGTGQELDVTFSSSGYAVTAARDLVLTNVSSGLSVSRFDGTEFSSSLVQDFDGFDLASARLDPALGRAVVFAYDGFSSQPSRDTLVSVNYLEDQTMSGCNGGTPNATGVQAELSAAGSPFAGYDLQLTASGLQPGSMTGMLVVGDQFTPPSAIPGSVGRLCVGGTIGRMTNQVQSADASGSHRYTISTSSIPTSAGTFAVLPGDSYTFQGWHRDLTPQGTLTSNTSTSLTVTFL